MQVKHLYPYFPENTRLVLQPFGGILCMPIEPENPGGISPYILTPLAAYLVRNCDGNRTIGELLTHFASHVIGEGFDAMQSVSLLMANFGRDRILKFSDQPHENVFRIFGSTEYCSPIHYIIELTDHCNLQCIHCYRKSAPTCTQYLPTGRTLTLFQTMAEHGVQTVEFTGGEPLTHPDFLLLLEKACSVFEKIAILTNGTLIDERVASTLRKHSSKAVVQIDLDGDSANVHDRLRGIQGSFRKACEAAKRLRRNGVLFRVAMNVYSGNFDRIYQTVMLAKQLGAVQFSFTPVIQIGRATRAPGLMLSDDQLSELPEFVRDLEAKYPDFVKVTPETPGAKDQTTKNCGAGWRVLVLGPSGCVRLCSMLSEKYGHFGNLLEEDYTSIIQRIPSLYYYDLQSPSEKMCQGCDYVYFCYGCLVRPFHAQLNTDQRRTSLHCIWDEKTGFFDLMENFRNEEYKKSDFAMIAPVQ